MVAIDGPAGTGKSSVAKEVSNRLGFAFLDTGAMYRAVGAACVAADVDPEDAEAAAHVARQIEYDSASGRFPGLDSSLRTIETTEAASRVAQHSAVRELLVHWQRQFAIGRNLVTEGRDQGTDVFPDAAVKFFLTATPEVRAQRRVAELERLGGTVDDKPVDYENVLKQITARDERDRNRTVSPLRPASDAIVVDTTHISIEDVISRLISIVNAKRSTNSDHPPEHDSFGGSNR